MGVIYVGVYPFVYDSQFYINIKDNSEVLMCAYVKAMSVSKKNGCDGCAVSL